MGDSPMSAGWLPVQKNLLRAVRFSKLRPLQRQVVLECLERQYGWIKRKGDDPQPYPLSPTALASLFGCSRLAARDAVKGLCSARVLLVAQAQGPNSPGLYLLNTQWSGWLCGFVRSPSEIPWTPRTGDYDPRAVVSTVTTAVVSTVTTTPVSTVTTTTPCDADGGALSGVLRDIEDTEKEIPPKPPRGRRVSSADKAAYVAHFRAEWERWTGKPSKMEDSTIVGVAEKALKKHGLAKCKLVLSWAFRAPDAGWHRGEGKSDKVYLKGSTLWRPSNFPGYLAEAESWAAGESSSAEFPPNDSLPLPQVADAFVDFHKGLKVMREPSGMWLPDSRKMLDPNLPWRAVLRDVMAGILRRRDAGERVDKYVPDPFLAALRECSHPARPEQQIHLSNILGRLVDEIEAAQ